MVHQTISTHVKVGSGHETMINSINIICNYCSKTKKTFPSFRYDIHAFCLLIYKSPNLQITQVAHSMNRNVAVTKSIIMLFHAVEGWTQRCYCELVTNVVYDNLQDIQVPGRFIQCSREYLKSISIHFNCSFRQQTSIHNNIPLLGVWIVWERGDQIIRIFFAN